MLKNIDNSKKFNYDLYGIDFPIRYKNQRKASSLTSKIFSIISYIIILILILFYIIEIYNHTNLNVVICQKYLFENYLLNFSEIPILIGIKNMNNELEEIDNNYYSLKIETNENVPFFKNGTKNIKNIVTNIELEKCNKNLLNNQIFSQISTQELNYLYCIKPNQNLSFYGRHFDFLNGFKSVDIILSKCNNETNNNQCKSQNEINEKIFQHHLFFYYISHKVNHLNISNPVQTYLKYEEYLVSQKFIKYFYYKILPSIYTTMTGFIFEKSKEYFFYEYHGTEFDVLENDLSDNNNNSNVLLHIYLTSDCHINHYYRSYTQIKDIIAKMGGIIDIIFILFQVVTNYLSKKSIHIEMINNLITNDCKEFCKNFGNFNKMKLDYSYTEFNNSNFILSNKNVEFKSMTIKNKISEKKNSNLNNNNNNLSVEINNLKENKIISNKSLKNYLDKKLMKKSSKQKLNLNWYEYFLPLNFLKKNKEFDLMTVFINIFHNLLSIENIIPMIERFNLLYTNSDIFNNNNVLFIFNIPKDVYINNNNNHNNNVENKEETGFEITKTNNNLITKKINVNKPINKNNE